MPLPEGFELVCRRGAIGLMALKLSLLANVGIGSGGSAQSNGPVHGYASRAGVWMGGDRHHGGGGNRYAGAQRISLKGRAWCARRGKTLKGSVISR